MSLGFLPPKPILGVVHLLPLPGSPRWGGDLRAVVERAVADAQALVEGGADGLVVENFGDLPFPKKAGKATVAAMTAVAGKVVGAVGIPVGVNVLRSDGEAALAIAHATGARFIRVNVFSGVAFTDGGVIEGEAAELLRLRATLRAEVAVLADVHVKHAVHLGTLAEAARDAARNGPDALIVTGSATGAAADPEDVTTVQRASGLPVLVGSGITPENLPRFAHADGFLVGTALKVDGVTANPVDPSRVRALVGARDRLFPRAGEPGV
ncbi:MAG: BtpA/SgcQ family protein [Candidatus Bipolaricaulota bacterium]|nr:BtpA/SgcQ family protein [Candidatus Bipolaricaulota bacterium]